MFIQTPMLLWGNIFSARSAENLRLSGLDRPIDVLLTFKTQMWPSERQD